MYQKKQEKTQPKQYNFVLPTHEKQFLYSFVNTTKLSVTDKSGNRIMIT